MGLFDRFKTNKVTLPTRKFDLKLPNGVAVGDYLLLEGDEEKREKQYEVFFGSGIAPHIWDNPLPLGETLHDTKIAYAESVIQGWSFKEKCTPRKVMEFVRSAPYLLNSLFVYSSCSRTVVKTESEYKYLLNNRDTMRDYSVLEQASGFVKYKLDKYGEDMQGHYFLFHKKYSHRYMALEEYLYMEGIREEQRDPPHTEDEYKRYAENKGMTHMAHLMADWSFKEPPSFDNKYNYLYQLYRDGMVTLELYKKIMTEKEEFRSLI